MTGNILQLDFNNKIFLGVPIIVAHMFGEKYLFNLNSFVFFYSKDIFFYSLFCSFSLGVPIIVEGTVELHRAYPGLLVGKKQVCICPSHDHMLSKLI